MWTRQHGKSRGFPQPVTLAEALESEGAAARAGMIERHRAYLSSMTEAASRHLASTPDDGLGDPDAGLALLTFAGELAAVVQPHKFRDQLPTGLVASCEQTVTAATDLAVDCLIGLFGGMRQLFSRPQIAPEPTPN